MEKSRKKARRKTNAPQAAHPASMVDVSSVRFSGGYDQEVSSSGDNADEAILSPEAAPLPDLMDDAEPYAPSHSSGHKRMRRGLVPVNQRSNAPEMPDTLEEKAFSVMPEAADNPLDRHASIAPSPETMTWAQHITVDRPDSFQPRDKRTSHSGRAVSERINRTGQDLDVTSIRADRASSRQPSLAGQIVSQSGRAISEVASNQFHHLLDQDEDENVSVQAVNDLSGMGESAVRTGERVLPSHHSKHRLPVDVGVGDTAKKTSSFGASNPASRLRQRRNLRQRYLAARRGKTSAAAAQAAGKSVKTAQKTGSFAARYRHGVVLAALAFLLFYLVNSLSACAPLVQTVISGVTIGTYPAEESDVLAAENVCRGMELALQDELNNYCLYHPEYDEATIEQQELWHDPYVLMALISATIGDSWTVDSAIPVMERLFERQYELTVNVETETRYQTEYDAAGREIQVPYTYSICHVTLVNNNLSHLPLLVLSHEQVSLYALYMSTLGNMPELFAGNPYASVLNDPMLYDVPEELLAADESFARLIEEAEKYIGFPYVWGGSSPETSFDCSGFISYVFTASGVYNIGHRSATGLHEMCQEISADVIRPGDLIFFAGTMGADVGGVTHVGLYVGNNMMIHCGSPISYADLNDSYWQQHFYSYGRVPY